MKKNIQSSFAKDAKARTGAASLMNKSRGPAKVSIYLQAYDALYLKLP